MKQEKYFYIIDGNSWLYRAYYAIKGELTSRDGFPTKAIFGVINMLLKVIKEKKPHYFAFVWDSPKTGFRKELYTEYKANRPSMPEDLSVQIPILKEIISYLGINQLEIEGAEADDLIASLSKKTDSLSQKIIVTLDKDLIPLIDDITTLWDPMKDEFLDEKAIKELYNISPAQFVDMLALAGDAVDNIPGIPSVGKKTALKLIIDYGSIQGIYDNLEKLSPKLRDNLINNKENLFLWKKLVTLDEEIPVSGNIEDHIIRDMNSEKLKEIFHRLRFESLYKIIPESAPKNSGLFHTDSEKEPESEEEIKINEINNAKELDNLFEIIKKTKIIGIDVVFDKNIFSPGIEKIYITIETLGIYLLDYTKNIINFNNTFHELKEIFSDKDIKKIGFGLKNILLGLSYNELGLEGIEGDIQIAQFLLDPDNKENSFLQKNMETERGRARFLRDIFKLHNDLTDRMVKENLIKCYTEVELPLITALFDMEKNGILIDKNAMKSLSEEWGTEILRIERQIYEISGDEFNINSSQQIGEILFTKLGLPSLKKSKKKTQYSTDVEVLTELAKIHPLPEKILAYRNLVKLKSTYADGLYSSINHHTGRIHTSYNQTLAVTGRISSTNPNLQNIPIRTHEGKKIRKLFIAKPGYTLVSADYSQIDLRVLAFYSNDDNLVKSFIEDMDIHARTASLVYGVPADMVSADMRRTAKTINFGIIYGMSPFGLSRALGIDTKKASEFIKTYFEKYPGVKKYMEEIIESARSHGYVKTILDRRRYIPNIKSNNKNIRESAERIAINTPIQGSSADIIKLAMKNIYGNLLNDNDCKMLLQVHDELLFEAKSEKIGFYVKIIKDIMENSYKINVPLRVNISLGANWEEIEKLSI